MRDIRLYRRLGGFDLVATSRDIVTIDSYESMIPIALFGGNVEGNTPSTRVEGQQNVDFWGNELLLQDSPELQFNSNTERQLRESTTTSRDRIKIENAVQKDLQFVKEFANLEVSVQLITVDRIKISIRLTKLDNLSETEFVFIWDNLQTEIEDEVINNEPPAQINTSTGVLNNPLNFPLS